MIKLLRKLATAMLPALLCGTLFIGCEADDKYTKVDDLFQPRFVLEKPEVKANSVTLVWYKVNDAISYTVQLHQDQYYTSLFMEIETTDPYVFIDDIPYGTTFYIRVRSNAANATNNSQWKYTSASTEARPEYAQLVEDVSKTEITESSAIIRWKKDNKQNPVDSISIIPMMNTTLPGISRYLTIEEMMQGFAEVDGLTKNTLYAVNLYDTSKPRKYDKPYNQVTFRTAGPSAMSIPVGLDDDLSAMLLNNDVDPEVPEGTEYYLPAGSSYRVTPFALMKGFRLAGSRDGVKPIVVLEGSWSIAEGSYLSSLEFDNIEFRHEANNNYFMNTSKAYTIENVSFVNCDFISLRRGFWRHQSANAKYIMNLEMEGCRFEGCGWQTSAYGAFNLQSFDKDNGVSYDQVDRAIFRNCTFSNDNDGTNGYGWGNLFYAPYMDKPIDLSTGLNFVRSNDPKFKKIPGFNQELDYIPSETLVYKVDSATAVAKGLATDSTGLLKEMTISLKGKTALGKQELMILDMLQTNNWERPIYYAITVNPDQFVGLDGYFEQTGLAYQIVPKQANKGTNTEKMYDNVMNKFKWGGVDKPGVYIDENVMRMCKSYRGALFNKLAEDLLKEGKKEKALNVLNKCMEVLPPENVPLDWTALSTGELYYALDETEKAEEVFTGIAENAMRNIDWFFRLRPSQLASVTRELEHNLAVMNQVLTVSKHYNPEFAAKYQEEFDNYRMAWGSVRGNK